MLGDQFGQAIVGHFGEFRRFLWIGKRFDGRQRQAGHLNIVTESRP